MHVEAHRRRWVGAKRSRQMITFDVNDARARDVFLRQVLLDALAPLRPDSAPRWGGMRAQDMVEHLEWAFAVSTAHVTAECLIPETQRERMRGFLYDNRPTPRGFMNPLLAGGLPPLRHAGLSQAQAALAEAVADFLAQQAATPHAIRTHPVFGPISLEEWSRSHYKHGHHHLRQFGLLPETDPGA